MTDLWILKIMLNLKKKIEVVADLDANYKGIVFQKSVNMYKNLWLVKLYVTRRLTQVLRKTVNFGTSHYTRSLTRPRTNSVLITVVQDHNQVLAKS